MKKEHGLSAYYAYDTWYAEVAVPKMKPAGKLLRLRLPAPSSRAASPQEAMEATTTSTRSPIIRMGRRKASLAL